MTEQDSGQGNCRSSLAAEISTDLLLVSMPFGPQVFQPSLALSLLKAEVKPLGVPTKVLYFTLRFAEQVGHRLYGNVSSNEPTTHGFVGEWIFSGALFPDRRDEIDNYVDDILRGRRRRSRSPC